MGIMAHENQYREYVDGGKKEGRGREREGEGRVAGPVRR